MAHQKGKMTAEGQKLFNTACEYGLGGFYQAEVGNLIIEPSKLTIDVMHDVLRFLSDHTEWVMGYEDIGTGEQVLYVSQADELNL